MSSSVSFIIYIGLFFTSKYVFDKYIPIIPKNSNCTPLTNFKIQASEGHPPTGSPKSNVFTIINIIAIAAIIQNINPTNAEITYGVVEKDTIPSIAYLNSFIKLNFVFPAILLGVS